MKHYYVVEIGSKDEHALSKFLDLCEDRAERFGVTLKVTGEFYR